MDHLSYKALHENFTSNNNGSSLFETFMVALPTLLGGSVVSTLSVGMSNCGASYSFKVFALEYLCMVFPTILSFTVLSDHLFILAFIILFIWGSLICYKSIVTQITLKNFKEKYFTIFLPIKFTSKQRSYITNFRSFTNISAVLCILAVDFQVFPRKFAKTETFGFGAMDLGVGLFVVGNALVAPEGRPGAPPHIPPYKIFLNNIPILFLGMARLGLTSAVGYQEHVSEYGTHWNFFFTLAITKMLSSFLMKLFKGRPIDYILFSGLLIIFYELILNLGVSDSIFSSAPRLNIWSANREGLASVVGYVALYFSGVSIRKIINERDELTMRSNFSLIKYFSSWAIALGIATVLCGNTFGVSRRLANLGYLLWVLSFSTSCIAYFIFCESAVCLLNIIFTSHKEKFPICTSVLCEAVNYNGLLFFLLGNVFTGLINLTVKTIFMGTVWSLFIISIYMFINCAVVTVMYYRKIQLKF